MNLKTWYAAKMTMKLGKLEVGDIVYVRRLAPKEPLAVGPVIILFQAKTMRSQRVADSFGRVCNLLPNNVNPEPAPREKNEEIEKAYRKFKKLNPIAERRKPTTKVSNRLRPNKG
jgi:hypothetical protein